MSKRSMIMHCSFTPGFKAKVVLEARTGVRSLRSMLALPNEAGSLLEMESLVFARGGNVLPKEAQNDPALAWNGCTGAKFS
jgi:hypothetical protein